MFALDVLDKAQFVVDARGNRQAVLVDYRLWEELLTLLEDQEDAEEIRRHREAERKLSPGNRQRSSYAPRAWMYNVHIVLRQAVKDIASLPREYARLITEHIDRLQKQPSAAGCQAITGIDRLQLASGSVPHPLRHRR